MRPIIARVLMYLGNLHPALKPTEEMGQAWDHALRDFSDEDLWRAAQGAALREHYGAPSVAALVAEIRGVERVIQVPVTDHWNARLLRDDGSPLTKPQLVRWYPDGREEPLALPKYDPNVKYDGGLGHIGGDLSGLLGDGETLTDPDN